jgi:hypothetical protein
MKKIAIINEDMMLGLCHIGSWRGLVRNWAGNHQFRNGEYQWMLFDSVEMAEQYLIKMGYCRYAGDRAMEDYCFVERNMT